MCAGSGAPTAEEDDKEELDFIGSPEGEKGSLERGAWFDDWATKKEAMGDGPGGDGPGGGMDPMAAMQQAMAAAPAGSGPGGQEQMMQMLMGMMQQQQQGGAGVASEEEEDGRQVRVTDLASLQASVAAHPALKWDQRMATLAGAEGIVKQDDLSDGTTHIRFPPPVGVVAWLPTDALNDL